MPKQSTRLAKLFFVSWKDPPHNSLEAPKCVHKAADKGHAAAQCELGHIYYSGVMSRVAPRTTRRGSSGGCNYRQFF